VCEGERGGREKVAVAQGQGREAGQKIKTLLNKTKQWVKNNTGFSSINNSQEVIDFFLMFDHYSYFVF
jgi:hypothetical protein